MHSGLVCPPQPRRSCSRKRISWHRDPCTNRAWPRSKLEWRASRTSDQTQQHAAKHSAETRLCIDADLCLSVLFFCCAQWPHNDASPSGWASSQPFTLALEGFFENSGQSSAADAVSCYACGTSLVHWSREDVPSTEHVRHARDANCPLVALRAQTGVSPSDLAIAAGLVKPSEAELAAASASASAASLSSAMSMRMQAAAAYSASEAILAESSARLRDRERVSFPSYHGLLNSLEIARSNAASAASNSSNSSSSGVPGSRTRMLPRTSGGGYSVVGGTSGASLSLARAGILTVPLASSDRGVARSPSPGTPSLSAPAAAASAAAASTVDKADPLYLPVPAADLHDIVYVRAQAASASAHAAKSATASSGYLAILDAYSSEMGGLASGSPSRHIHGGATTASTPLSAFDRIRARHLKRSHSLFSADTYARSWPNFEDEDAGSVAAATAGLKGAKLSPAAAAELARLQAATASAKESYRSVKRVRHAAAKGAMGGDAGATQVLADLQQRVAVSKQRYSTAKAMEQAMTQSLQRQQQQKDEARGGNSSDEEEAPASPSDAAPVSSAMLHALLLQEITTAALLHSAEL